MKNKFEMKNTNTDKWIAERCCEMLFIQNLFFYKIWMEQNFNTRKKRRWNCFFPVISVYFRTIFFHARVQVLEKNAETHPSLNPVHRGFRRWSSDLCWRTRYRLLVESDWCSRMRTDLSILPLLVVLSWASLQRIPIHFHYKTVKANVSHCENKTMWLYVLEYVLENLWAPVAKKGIHRKNFFYEFQVW